MEKVKSKKPENENKETRLIEKARRSGDANTILRLGMDYEYGEKPQRDQTKALRYYQMAADLGSVAAYSQLGRCYLYGQGVDKNSVKARFYLDAAAEQGDVAALWRLGDFYFWGSEGVAVDRDLAVRLYMQAYELSLNGQSLDLRSYPEICVRLADCFYHGISLERNMETALDLYSEALLYLSDRLEAEDDPSARENYQRAVNGFRRCRIRQELSENLHRQSALLLGLDMSGES